MTKYLKNHIKTKTMNTDVIETQAPEIKTEYFDKNVKSIIEAKMKDKAMTFPDKRDWLARYVERTYPNDIAKALELLDFGAKIEAGLQE